ncbi:hypothetical protein ACFQQB_25390 [Nonomuraea rubra]|uniref:hypothetical protein n=1 Tax=Nonomuraea rubra TaxID=46180 RepID=UPI003380D8AE
MAVLLVLLLHWPTSDSESELRLVQVFALAPFLLSMAVAGFIPAALLCAWLFGGKPAGTPQGDSELRA